MSYHGRHRVTRRPARHARVPRVPHVSETYIWCLALILFGIAVVLVACLR